MTQQEQQMIDDLVTRIRSTQLAEKDKDAEQRLQQGLADYPDALYVLAQTVLVQQYGLNQAQQRLQALHTELDTLHQQQAAPMRSSGSFLSSIFGSHEPPPPPPQYAPVNNPGYANQGYPPYVGQAYPAQGSPVAYPQPGYGGSSFGGGFLRGAMQTAAGVAAGEMMFQGMESLFHGFGGGGYGGRGFEGGSGGETINNYYGAGESGQHEAGTRDRDDNSFYNPQQDASRDATDSGGSSSPFADAQTADDSSFSSGDDVQNNYADNSDDGSAADDSGDDNSDFSSGDDGGSGGDDGGGF